MNDTITKLMALADEYMIQERDGTNGFEARKTLQDGLVRLFTPLSDEQIELISFNVDDGDWNNQAYRKSWHEGFFRGAREVELEHGITGEKNEHR